MMANWYARTVVPQIVRLGCGCAALAEYRARVVPQAQGRVLEIGFGAGANLRFYDPSRVISVTGLEPSAELRDIAQQTASGSELAVDVVDAAGEDMPFASGRFDTVLCTFTLCSVADVARTLAEARRVLAPGGQFLFCEHGLSALPEIRKWQRRIDPVWHRVLGGCHINRPVRAAIERAFAIEQWTGLQQEQGLRIAGWMEWGKALPR